MAHSDIVKLIANKKANIASGKSPDDQFAFYNVSSDTPIGTGNTKPQKKDGLLKKAGDFIYKGVLTPIGHDIMDYAKGVAYAANPTRIANVIMSKSSNSIYRNYGEKQLLEDKAPPVDARRMASSTVGVSTLLIPGMRIPGVIAKASPAVRLLGSSVIRGAEGAAMMAVREGIETGSAKQAVKSMPKNFAIGAITNAVLSPRLAAKAMGFGNKERIISAAGEVADAGVRAGSTSEQNASAWGKITNAIKNSGELTAEQEKLRKQWIAVNAKRLDPIYEQFNRGLIDDEELGKQLSSALKKMKRVDFSLGEEIPAETKKALLSDITKFDGFTVFEKKNAVEAVRGIFEGRLPTEYEKKLLAQIAPEDFMNAVASKGTAEERISDVIGNAIGSVRSGMTGPDISASGRQTFALAFKDPKAWYQGLKAGLKGMMSEADNNKVLSDMMSDPDYQLMRESGISAPSLSAKSGLREESISGNLPEKIPGIGKLYRASNRNYETTVFAARFYAFKNMKAAAERAGIDLMGNGKRELKGIGEVINNLTGKGGKWLQKKGYTGTLSTGFFAPKLMASRINVFNPIYYLSLPEFARREALKSLMSLSAGVLTTIGLAKYYAESTGKGTVSLDLSSADFGKLKLGNSRIDLTGGYTQYIRTLYQIIAGKKTSTITGKTKKVNEGYKGITRYSLITDFLENKAAPIPSAVISALKGEDAVGKKVTPLSIAQSFEPLLYQDIRDILTEGEDISGLMYVPLALLGIGVQTYGGKNTGQGVKVKAADNGVPSIEKIKPKESTKRNIKVDSSTVNITPKPTKGSSKNSYTPPKKNVPTVNSKVDVGKAIKSIQGRGFIQ